MEDEEAAGNRTAGVVSNQVGGHDERNRDQAGITVIRGTAERGAVERGTVERSAGTSLKFRFSL